MRRMNSFVIYLQLYIDPDTPHKLIALGIGTLIVNCRRNCSAYAVLVLNLYYYLFTFELCAGMFFRITPHRFSRPKNVHQTSACVGWVSMSF